MTPTAPLYNPKPDAERYTLLLWAHIGKRITALLGNHHYNHEPGGKDVVRIPVGGLVDVSLGTVVTSGEALVYDSVGTCWTNGAVAAGGGTAYGQAFFMAAGSLATGVVPGPTNMGTATLTVTEVRVAADDEVAGNVTPGGGFSFSAGGGASSMTGEYDWDAGAALSILITSAGTANQTLTVDVRFR